ncbi:MAG: rhomboid family intramembrane serine protease [Gemmatimonadetes bacterium]|nr:rhomboid family intramembrane serine protease [Gemmatimonadota bacterium]
MAYRGSFSFGFGLTPWVKNLIIANVAIFLVDYMMGGRLSYYMAFVPGRILSEPWTVITYMFAHGGGWHIFLNMLVLFFFGPPLEQRWGSSEFLKYYFLCGLGGAALSFVFAPMSPIIGASAAVYGVMLAFAMFWPDSPIYIWGILPVKAKYLVLFMAVVSVMSMFGSGRGDNIAHAAHLGGFAAGFLYLRLGSPGGGMGGLRKMMNRRKLKVVSRDDDSARRPAAPTRTATSRGRGNAEEEKLLDELDRVLEKISTQGMSSLSPQERKLLDEVSRRYRTD